MSSIMSTENFNFVENSLTLFNIISMVCPHCGGSDLRFNSAIVINRDYENITVEWFCKDCDALIEMTVKVKSGV